MISGLMSTSFSSGRSFEADVDHGDAFGDADLRSGEADALRGVHARQHLLDKLRELRLEDREGAPCFASTGSGYFTIG